jgi:transcriptional regulator with XRE-family HTH domain
LLLAGPGGAQYSPGVRTFGANLKDERERLEISQETLAQRLGVRQAQVSAWEKGRRRPNAASVLRIAEALGCAPAELLTGVVTDLDALRGVVSTAPRTRTPRLTRDEKKLLREFRKMNEKGQRLAIDQVARLAPAFPLPPSQGLRAPQSHMQPVRARKEHGTR